MTAASATRPIAEIRIGKRHRVDFGDVDGFAARIASVGLLQPIVVTPSGELIDGQRRLQACKKLGWSDVPVHVVNIDAIARGELSANVDRKDFTPSELVAIAETVEKRERELAKARQIASLKRGDKKIPVGENFPHGRARDKIAAPLGVSGRTLEKARAVVDAARRDPETYRPIVVVMDSSGNVDRAFKQVQILARQQENAARAEHGCTVADLVALAESGKRFPVIYADPPWPWETFGPPGRIRSCADHHYGLSTVDEIKKLPVAQLAAADAALLLWGTWPKLPDVLNVIQAWGFTYKTAGFVWVKLNPSGNGLHTGMGYWTRSNSEYCLLATKGAPKRLRADVPEVVLAPVGEHSEKPEEVRQRIERLFAGPYLELYGRKPVDGWTVFGNEIERGSFGEAAQ